MKPRQNILIRAMTLIVASAFGSLGSAAPATPTLESPADGAGDLSTTTTVRWSRSLPGETYRVQVAKDALFHTMLLNATVQDTTGYTLFGLSKTTTYYWRVNASKDGQSSAWSPVWSFTVTSASAPAAPELISPANGQTGVSITPTLVQAMRRLCLTVSPPRCTFTFPNPSLMRLRTPPEKIGEIDATRPDFL